MVCCCVYNCKNTNFRKQHNGNNEKYSLFRIPAIRKRFSEERRKLIKLQQDAWISSLKMGKLNEQQLNCYRICNEHFIDGRPAQYHDVNNPNWKPTLKMGYNISSTCSTETVKLRYNRFKNRQNYTAQSLNSDDQISIALEHNYSELISRRPEEIVPTSNNSKQILTSPVVQSDTYIGLDSNGTQNYKSELTFNNSIETQTILLHQDITFYEEKFAKLEMKIASLKAEKSCLEDEVKTKNNLIMKLQNDMNERNHEIYMLQEKVSNISLTEASFKNNNKKLHYFTGLPSLELFNLFLSGITSELSQFKVKNLNNFQKLLLTLMKLRFNCNYQSLAYRFDIKLKNVSRCFEHVIILIDYVYSDFIHWPSRDALRTAVPLCFQHKFGKSIAVIVDCFEIKSQRPSNARARACNFSTYKHDYTSKYLLGITTHGFISFISEGWGGRGSDEMITEESSILDNLEPGDIIMCDRGFTIKESVSLQYAELLQPDFLMKKRQLSPSALEKTRKIASVRIHVERIISVIKNRFKILKGPVLVNQMKYKYNDKPFIDYIVRVVCILTNVCDSVIPINEEETNSNYKF